MGKLSAGEPRAFRGLTCAIWGRFETFWIVKSVVFALFCGDLKSTSKKGSSSVAAGWTAMSQLSSLFVVVGLMMDVPANAEVAKTKEKSMARKRIVKNLPPPAYAKRAQRLARYGAGAICASCRTAGEQPLPSATAVPSLAYVGAANIVVITQF